MAEGDEPIAGAEEQVLAMQHIKERLDLLDRRLDNIDSTVSVVAERVMSQFITMNITCAHCGKNIEIAIVSSQKPRR